MSYANRPGAMSVNDELERFFPNHRSPDRPYRLGSAQEMRETYGQPVTGTVVAKSPFGAWVDLGVAFPPFWRSSELRASLRKNIARVIGVLSAARLPRLSAASAMARARSGFGRCLLARDAPDIAHATIPVRRRRFWSNRGSLCSPIR